jgi:hypothetical protein
VNAISEDISHEIPSPFSTVCEDVRENIFKLKRQAKFEEKKKSSLFIIFRGYLSF